MGTEDESQLTLQGRAAAAAGAALVAACIVNPLDVIKTRIQAQAMAESLGQKAACSSPWTCSSTLYERWGITEGPLPIRRTPPFPVPRGWVPPAVAPAGAAAAAAAAAATASGGVPSGAVAALAAAGAPASLAAASCSCTPRAAGAASLLPSAAAAAAAAAATSGAGGSGGSLAACATTSMTQQQQSMWEVAKAIARREGVPVLWRGTAASLLIAVPMVGIYMPLYDALLASWAGSMGGLGPVASGITARVSACFCVAPFELLRTRLQASAAAGVSMRSTISSLVAEHHAAAALQQQAQAAAAAGPANGSAASSAALAVAAAVEAQPVRAGALLRAVPRMWTGFSATLVRDVPFSAMYWALVEPLRQAMLPRNSHWKPLQTLADRTQAAYSNSVLSKRGGGRHGSGGGSGSGSSGAPPARRVLPSQQHLHHSQLEILIANMVSGCVAGGVAAAVTTPFDVAKTRMQISTPAQQQAHAARAAAAAAPAAVAGGAGGAGGSAGAGWLGNVKVFSVLREVYHREGLEGLFTGVKPRAFRAAPACGIVISVYELLKSFLTPPE